jgi:hypothetical protein
MLWTLQGLAVFVSVFAGYTGKKLALEQLNPTRHNADNE